jgi:endonuclease/exonuclease/phosphatase family metal-dependent hydrolase
MRRFRVATYNTHKSRGLDLRVRPDRIIAVLEEIDADIVALQEVLSVHGSTREADQIGYMTEALKCDWAFGYTQDLWGGKYGNLLLTRFPVRCSRTFDISFRRRRSRRGVLRVDVEVPGAGLLHVFNIHLGTAFFERRYQARRLMSEEILLSEDLSAPRVVLGDFNEWTRGLVTHSLSEEMESADIRYHLQRRGTYPGVLPLMHLDHIYHDPEIRVRSLRLHRSPMSMIASDHLPLVADVEYRSPNGQPRG